MSEAEDLSAQRTEGYKGPGALRTEEELNKLEYRDESLKKWEASLGLGATAAAAGTGPPVEVLALKINSGDKELIIDLKKGSRDIVIKEGVEFTVSIQFQANQIVAGLQYVQIVKRSGIRVAKTQCMIGSYGPSAEILTKAFAAEEAPSGMLARADYTVKSRVTDDDAKVHADFEWHFKIKKNWE